MEKQQIRLAVNSILVNAFYFVASIISGLLIGFFLLPIPGTIFQRVIMILGIFAVFAVNCMFEILIIFKPSEEKLELKRLISDPKWKLN